MLPDKLKYCRCWYRKNIYCTEQHSRKQQIYNRKKERQRNHNSGVKMQNQKSEHFRSKEKK